MHVRLADIRMANEASDSPETAVTLEIWLHRARLALLVGALDLAEHCLRRALHLGAASVAYVLLAELALKRQDLNASKAALAIARHKGEAGRARSA